ncbi:RNA 2',3'-cyclic phosphodiesterase [Paenibacillus senegalensis]|uniref:RNA 2',3'-cyclic phosphodiesterase n=1 Tax=Paenibacillus senegalensis TaxID=1465766 RepID=UPI0002F4276E|nr:RNA 2',3'-cyclic phosphodiesterase [Paenibacillus senegalensis]
MNRTMEKLRLFIAVPVAPEIKERLSSSIRPFQQSGMFRRWTHPEDYHITLKFLGDTEAGDADKITDLLSQSLNNSSPLTLSLQGFGIFGAPKAPSVLWAGVGGDTEQLIPLNEAVETAMMELGWPREARNYHPHLTLARQYSGSLPFSPSALPAALEEELSWTADRIIVYRSHLKRKPMYEPYISIPLH